MPIIKEKIKFNNQDVNLTFGLSGVNQISGYQQEIDGLTEDAKDELINPIVDNEVRRFIFEPNDIAILGFYFDSDSPHVDFEYAGFTSTEIEDADTNMLNSFFIMDFYDSFDPYTQTKISTTYNTQILEGNTSGGVQIPGYVNNNDKLTQFYYLNVPKTFIDAQTGHTATGYTKFSFYNAKYGLVHLFYNIAVSNAGVTTPEKMYFKTTLNLYDMTWNITTGLFASVAIYEMPRTGAYVEKVNDAVDNFSNEQQQYPNGSVFNDDGKYLDEEGNEVSTRRSRSSSTTPRTPRTR